MALQIPGYTVMPNSPSPLDGVLEAFDQGRQQRRDEQALDAAAKAFGAGGQIMPAPPSAIERLSGLFSPGQPQTALAAANAAAAPVDIVTQSHNAAATATDPVLTDYFARARTAESGGNDLAANSNSSALGRYQFLASTWDGLMNQYPELGLTADGRTDPGQQERAMARFTQDNAQALSGAGIPVNPGNLYAAHFLGAGGASNVLRQDPSSPLSAYLGPGVLEANPHLNGMTVGDFSAWANSKGGNSSGGYAPPARDEGRVAGARQFTPDPETLRALLSSDATRELAVSLITAQQNANASQGRYVVEQGEDGTIWQRDTLTGELSELRAPAKPAAAPSSVQEYEFARSQGYTGTYEQWKTANKSSTNVTVNTGEGQDSALNKALSEAEGKAWASYKEAGTVSSANAQDFQVLDQLIGVAPQGALQGRLAALFPGFNSAGDAFQSIVKRIAPTLRAPGSGSTSDIEYNGMLQSLPALQNDPAANQMILSIMKAKAEVNMQRAEIITRYQNGELQVGEARRALNDLDRISILTPEMRAALAGIGGSAEVDAAAPKVGDVVDGYRFDGGNPADANSWTKVE